VRERCVRRRFHGAVVLFSCLSIHSTVGYATASELQQASTLGTRWRTLSATVAYCVRGIHDKCQENLSNIVKGQWENPTAPASRLTEVRVGMFTHPVAISFRLFQEIARTGSCNEAAHQWQSPIALPGGLSPRDALQRLIQEAEAELADQARWPAENKELAELRRTIQRCLSE
jgi:hypothetical protein